MKIEKHKSKIKFDAENGSLVVDYDNRGEPFREGIGMCLETEDDSVNLFLEESEGKKLRDFLINLFSEGAQ